MSQEQRNDNQSPNPRESARSSEPGFPFYEQGGDQPTTPSARVSIPQTPGNNQRSHRSRPTSSNASASSPPKLSRRKSSYIPSEESDDSDEHSDDSKNSKKRKRRGLKKRLSYRRRSEDNLDNDNEEGNGNDDEDKEPDEDSDHELTIKDRQEVINTTHPFGMPLWKSALYKKSRSVIRDANSVIHSTPTAELYLSPGNILWAIVFGWELALASFIVSLLLSITPCGGGRYAVVLRELSYYIFWPFGKYVEKIDEWSDETDEDGINMNHTGYHGSSLMGNGIDIENNVDNPLLGRRTASGSIRRLEREGPSCCGIGLAEFVFYFLYFLIVAPLFLIVSALCWFSVIGIPMAKLTYVISNHLRKHPLSIHFKSGSSLSSSTNNRSSILLCTYKAIGLYYKYTYDGINIIFINLISLVVFSIIDNYIISEIIEDPENHFITSSGFIFTLSLVSVVPLSYFIGMAVASISAQSSAGLGAVINATFGSIIEIILYSMALTQGKGKLAEGSIIGSLLCGVLLMPGLSMISGGLKRKEQKFNAKSAGVTSTMLIMAIIGALTPTLFYQTYAPYIMNCRTTPCINDYDISCQICQHTQVDPIETKLYNIYVKPLMYFCATILILSYLIGLWFTLHTHAALMWQSSHHTPEHDQSIYRRLVPLHILQQILPLSSQQSGPVGTNNAARPMSAPEINTNLSPNSSLPDGSIPFDTIAAAAATLAEDQRFRHAYETEEEASGHDSPNWSKEKSVVVLLTCTVLYTVIAEMLIHNVEVISSSVDEKLLGLTLFAIVPSFTEFVNAMGFALNGNIALSMEIGSAYALQVCLLQIPAMVLFSEFYNRDKKIPNQVDHTFTLVFPRWDVFSVVLSVFLLSYTYIEGKANYFKGSILVLSYLVLMAGFFCAPLGLTDNY
ncbi:Sodium/calcium exchanger protein-domain-containing protein [Gigaspora margarita]|uniref:Sodium/calcium exchanger protein-domain-containing protein n=1 Tax=Gigaspora margarita TaxID=4874 RepID=A0A8H3ZZT1_GIGMA|nr:Sodium/calcium exchanger protein-domain-containing protein [Gigaspora margarita]